MSQYHNPPRQDRRGKGRAPVCKHNEETVGTNRPEPNRPTILDPKNGAPFGAGRGGAPGAVGPAVSNAS
jgi:hypothetical protein